MKKKTDVTPSRQGQEDKLTTSFAVPVILSYLTPADKNALFTSNLTFYRKFQPNFILTSLLQYVVAGNQDKVIQILGSSPQLMVIQGLVTEENSQRTFLNASAVELVRWCGDLRYMGTAMLDILKELPDRRLAEEIRAKWEALDDAYDENQGLDYLLPGSTEPTRSLAFSLAPLFHALQDYIDTFDTMTWEQRIEKWSTKVGAEQFLLPAYYLQHYCNPNVPFYPTPSFDAPTFPRCLEIYNYNTLKPMCVWGDVDKGDILGWNFGFVRGFFGVAARADGGRCCPSITAWNDLVALRACEEKMGLDRAAFKQKLREPLNQQPVAEQKSSHDPNPSNTLTTSSVLPVILSYLKPADKNSLFISNLTLYRKFQPNFILTSLLQSVITGNQDKVIQILGSSPQLMVIQGRVTEKNAQRTFLNASAVELVRWCGDVRYMGTAMLDILKNLPDRRLAEEIRAKWEAFDDAYEENRGLDYMLPGSTEPRRSLAFSLAPLFHALQEYVETFDTMNWEQRAEKWSTNVGAEQFLLPAYYLQHYCNPDVPFDPTPSFDAPTFPRCLEIHNYNTGKLMSVWGDVVAKGDILGRNFGVSRWGAGTGSGGRVWPVWGVESDLVALRACEERIRRDLAAFGEKLREPLHQEPVAEQKSSHGPNL